MKNITLVLLVTAFMSCKTDKKKEVNVVEDVPNGITAVSSKMMETAVIYEANIRQYSPEGTFAEFTKDIPQLKQLGVKIIWMMPIFPISETKRKATGGDFANLIEDETERKKMLGSYYAVSDFRKVNPEFGTIEDFRTLLKTAHQNGIYVILDWVPNHTGWDHTWLKTNPEFYTKNDKGEITHPLKEDGTSIGWDDVADLNYESEELRKTMIADMKYWITEENIDGFRCDVAGAVPTDFWKQAIPQLRQEKELFMLAEAWEPELLHNNLFDMAYGWDTHHLINAMAKSEKNLKDWEKLVMKNNNRYESNDILMNFVTNHDENSWNGTIAERMGDASEIMTAFSYVVPGMPLIYSGQEYDLSYRLKFFEKDSIPKIKGKTWELLKKLGALKNSNPALNGGKNPASYNVLKTNNENVLVFKRSKNGNHITFIGNMFNQEQTINNILKGNYLDYMSNSNVVLSEEIIILKPWEYKILVE
ncbi:alpha-amylase [Flavobacteriaceae bacterium AH-315-B10]|nr:alpha-amylase [Flavobacteriaceae bacterium AH-315-B10]